ncbi:nitrilotriacetate monooxygenase component B [Vibrio ishigakensis]|uniref:Nitrilotriacetate monooxygenase component B n=1 Tax=Vibrio ishigakensis TaxID=1481914 RepID=A0A0B8QFP9_9VIBR|nr:nitrilotriacetate monooxygenase component B [Vibrio ishigakensis]
MQTIFNQNALSEMEDRFRARFINSLSGFKSANLIGTVDSEGQENLSIVSSVFHLGANPPLMGFIIRPSSVERHTLENILATGVYTINSVTRPIAKQAHQTSARYLADVSEFRQTGLTPQYLDNHPAPFVEQSPLKIAMRLREHQTLAINGTELIIGEIERVILPSNAVRKDGYVDVESMQIVCVSGLDSYHRTDMIHRLSYAKPDKVPQVLTRDGQQER